MIEGGGGGCMIARPDLRSGRFLILKFEIKRPKNSWYSQDILFDNDDLVLVTMKL